MDKQSQKPSESIIIGNCLNCQGLVRVPATAPAKSRVRCPHCSESYLLYEILNQSVPELELVEEPKIAVEIPRVDQILIKTESDREEKQKFVVPPQLTKGARRSGRRHRSSDSSDFPERTSGSSNRESGELRVSTKQPERFQRQSESTHRSRVRHRGAANSGWNRGERNTVIEMLKVVVGGVLAIPIAYLLVFWFFKQDPLNVGPKLGRVVPFLVPSEFRGNKVDDSWYPVDHKKEDLTEKADEEGSSHLPILDVDPDRN